MKRKPLIALFALSLLLLCIATLTVFAEPGDEPPSSGDVVIDETNFPDEALRNYVIEHYDEDCNGVLSAAELAAVTKIELHGGREPRTLKGIEYFTELTYLDCSNAPLISLDLSKNTKLRTVFCYGCGLTSLDVSMLPDLGMLYCKDNQLTSLDLSHNPRMNTLSCSRNNLGTLDLSNNTELFILECSDAGLNALNITRCAILDEVYCGGNNLTELDISGNTKLQMLVCYENRLTRLDLSRNEQLSTLDVRGNLLTSLDFSGTKLGGLVGRDWLFRDNRYTITIDENRSFDLSTLPEGFDVRKTSNWTGGSAQGNILTVEKNVYEITYTYACGMGVEVVFTLVTTEHRHQYTSLDFDENNHWWVCSDPECTDRAGSIKDIEPHIYTDYSPNKCVRMYCGYERPASPPSHTHNYVGWYIDEEYHWRQCAEDDCPEPGGAIADKSAHIYDSETDPDCNVCDYRRTLTHKHSYAGWHSDETNHWHECADESCPDRSGSLTDKAAHSYDGDADEDCNVCGFKRTIVTEAHIHDADASRWGHDEAQHWQVCSGCEEHLNAASHSFVRKVDLEATKDSEGLEHEECSVCGYRRNEGSVIPKLGEQTIIDLGKSLAVTVILWIVLGLCLAGAAVGTVFIILKRKSIR